MSFRGTAFVFAVFVWAAGLSMAQTPAAYPVKPITMIVPFRLGV